MRKLIIQSANLSLVIVVLIGIPVVSSWRFGALRLTSEPTLQWLTLWGLALAAGLNLAAAFWIARNKPLRQLCFRWLWAHLILLVFHFLLFEGHVHFEWLKNFLLWLQRRF